MQLQQQVSVFLHEGLVGHCPDLMLANHNMKKSHFSSSYQTRGDKEQDTKVMGKGGRCKRKRINEHM